MTRVLTGTRTTLSTRTRITRSSLVSRTNQIANPSTLVVDNFINTNSTSLSSHTPDKVQSGGWTQTNASSFYIQSNTCQPNRYTNGDLAYIEVNTNNYTINCNLTPFNFNANAGNPGLVFRYIDSNNYWYAYIDAANGILVIYSITGGVATEQSYSRFTRNVTFLSGKSIAIQVDCINQNMTFWVNGSEQFTLTSGINLAGTKVGIYLNVASSPSSKCSWSSFSVTPFAGSYIAWPLYTENSVSSPVIALGAGGSWEAEDINDPSVQFDSANSRWIMAYTGNPNVTNVQALGIAYATNLLGPWTKEASNPVYNGTTGAGGINGGLLRYNNKWYYYFGNNGATTIDLLTSTDLLTWTSQGTVLSGTSGSWDSGGVFDAFVRLKADGTTIELWYGGISGGVFQLGFATSTNGTTFTKSSLNPVFKDQPFSLGTIGEPCAWVPSGQEGRQWLISYDGATYDNPNNRFIIQAFTFDAMQTWHYRVNALTAQGSGWESIQVFDSDMITDTNNNMYMFHSGAAIAGHGLELNSQIGVAQTNYTVIRIVR